MPCACGEVIYKSPAILGIRVIDNAGEESTVGRDIAGINLLHEIVKGSGGGGEVRADRFRHIVGSDIFGHIAREVPEAHCGLHSLAGIECADTKFTIRSDMSD